MKLTSRLATCYAPVAMGLFLTAFSAQATTPLTDTLDYDGIRAEVWPSDRAWIDFPQNETLQELRRAERCTALGGPRARWRIFAHRLWLTGVFTCGANIPLASIYGGTGNPILATWVTGKLLTYKGKQLCYESYGSGIHEKTVSLRVENGVVLEQTEESNLNHPALYTLDELRVLVKEAGLEPSDVKKLRDGMPCLSPAQQKKLRGGTASPPAAP